MSIKKRETNDNIRAISLEEKKTSIEANEPVFSRGLYDWVMFIFVYYSRIRETLKIDFESFIVLQVVVSHSLYHLNKDGAKKFSEIEKNVELLSMSKLSSKLINYHLLVFLRYCSCQEKLFEGKY